MRCWSGALLEGRLSWAQDQRQTPAWRSGGGFESPNSGLRFRHKRFIVPPPTTALSLSGYSFLKREGPSWPWLHKQVSFTWLHRAGQRLKSHTSQPQCIWGLLGDQQTFIDFNAFWLARGQASLCPWAGAQPPLLCVLGHHFHHSSVSQLIREATGLTRPFMNPWFRCQFTLACFGIHFYFTSENPED